MNNSQKFNYSYLLGALTLGLILSNYYWYQKSAHPIVASESDTTADAKPAVADFSKKAECAQYRAAIEKKLEPNTVGNMSYGGVLLELFYSPSLDTCISGHESITLQGKEVTSDRFIIKDVLTGEVLYKADDQASYKAQLATYQR